jgi:peptide/nickel transport system substrate-binding protein
VEHYGKDFFQHPVGTGPFAFESWSPDQHLMLRRNPKYWMLDDHGNRLPLLDGVRFSFMKDDKMQLLEFQGGNLEESYRIPNEFFADIVDERKQLKGPFARFTLLRVPSVGTQYYGMLMTDPVFRDKRIRQAFNYAVDRSRIIRYVLRGQAFGPATHGLVPPALPGYPADRVKGYTFDPVTARALLAEAGYPDGKGFPKVTLQLNAGGGRNAQVAEAIQGMLAEHLNVSIELTQVEFAQHLERIDAGQTGFYRLGWVGDYPDPETFLNLFYGKLVPKDGGVSPINSVRYVNPAFDAVFEQAIGTTDHAARMDLFRQAEQIAIDDAPMLILFYDEDYRLVQRYVRDYRNNAMDKRPYKFIWFDASSQKR